MSVGFVAFHYPAAQHFEGFVERTRQGRDLLQTCAGLEDVQIWATPDRDAVITTVRFQTTAQLRAAFADPRVSTITIYDDRERASRKIIDVVSR